MKKFLVVAGILILLFFILVRFMHVAAATTTVGDLQVTWNNPLFPSSTVWYPGLTVEKSFTVKNIGATTHKTSLDTANTSQIGDLANNIFLRIDQGTNNYFGGSNDKTMKNFWDNGVTYLSDISSGDSKTYTVSVSMPTTLDNKFQGASAKFDLIVGFVGTESTVNISGGAGDGLSDGRSDGLSDGRSSAPLAHGGAGEEILGAQTQQEASGSALTPTPTPTPNGQILGQHTIFSGMCIFLWFLILLLLVLLLWIVLRKRRRHLK